MQDLTVRDGRMRDEEREPAALLLFCCDSVDLNSLPGPIPHLTSLSWQSGVNLNLDVCFSFCILQTHLLNIDLSLIFLKISLQVSQGFLLRGEELTIEKFGFGVNLTVGRLVKLCVC